MSTDWVTVGSPITIVRDAQLPFYQVQPWKEAAYWEAAQHPVAEPVPVVKVAHRGVVPRAAAVVARQPAARAAQPKKLARLPVRRYPRAAARKAPVVVARAEEPAASLLVPIYNVVTAPLKKLPVAARSADIPLSAYTDQQLGTVPGYNAKTRVKDSLPGY